MASPTTVVLYNPANMDEAIVFPVTPTFKDEDAALRMSWSVARRGGISRPLGRQERVYTFSALLPGPAHADKPWVQSWRAPDDIIKQLKAWHAPVAKEGVPLRLVVTGMRNVSDPVYISKRGGNHNDNLGGVVVDLELIEIRNLLVRYDGEGDPATQTQGPVVAGDDPDGDPPPAPDTPSEYAVQDGDSLYNIAAAQLGDGDRWQEIYDVNKDTIGDDPNSLLPGMVLQLPSQGGGQADASDEATDAG